jgi:hypothetical protein
MVSLAKGITTTQPALIFFLMKMVICVFVVVVAARACFVVAWKASVNCVHCSSSECCVCDAWCKCHVAAYFIISLQVLHHVFFFVLDALVTRDLRHEYAQSA